MSLALSIAGPEVALELSMKRELLRRRPLGRAAGRTIAAVALAAVIAAMLGCGITPDSADRSDKETVVDCSNYDPKAAEPQDLDPQKHGCFIERKLRLSTTPVGSPCGFNLLIIGKDDPNEEAPTEPDAPLNSRADLTLLMSLRWPQNSSAFIVLHAMPREPLWPSENDLPPACPIDVTIDGKRQLQQIGNLLGKGRRAYMDCVEATVQERLDADSDLSERLSCPQEPGFRVHGLLELDFSQAAGVLAKAKDAFLPNDLES